MKLLKQPERTIMAADNSASPIIIIVDDPAAAQELISSTRRIPAYQQSPQAIKIISSESRIQGLIRNEREILRDSWDAFSSATREFVSTLVSWIIWRIVVPLSVMSVLWMTFAESAELPA